MKTIGVPALIQSLQTAPTSPLAFAKKYLVLPTSYKRPASLRIEYKSYGYVYDAFHHFQCDPAIGWLFFLHKKGSICTLYSPTVLWFRKLFQSCHRLALMSVVNKEKADIMFICKFFERIYHFIVAVIAVSIIDRFS